MNNSIAYIMKRDVTDKIKGCLYGQAIGDALGLGTEFLTKQEVARYYPEGLSSYEEIIQDSHRKRWVKGDWTDDTDMMLCLLNAFDKHGFSYAKAAANFKEWFNGIPMGIGRHTVKVLMLGDYLENPFLASKIIWESTRKESAANGALMRTSVMGLWPKLNRQWISEACKLTHYDPRCEISCLILSKIIYEIVWNSILPTLNNVIEWLSEICEDERKEIESYLALAYYNENISSLEIDKQPGIGYTYRSLSVALWCLWHSESFEDGLLKVVNEGGDADTNAAIACAVLGAKYGYASIPSYYINGLYETSKYENIVSNFILLLEKVTIDGFGLSNGFGY